MFDYNLRINKKACFRFTLTRWILLLLAVFGIFIMVYRLLNGLGDTTHLSNEWPWGFWIYADLVLSALGACGFAVGILGHVLQAFGTARFINVLLLLCLGVPCTFY